MSLEKGHYLSPRWTGEIADCSLPVTFDTYSNCAFGCVYCFSQYQRGVGGGKEQYFQKSVKAVSVDRIKKLFTGQMPNSQFWPYIKDKRPIQYGGLSDQFDGFERQYGVTYEVLKFLREINYPICFSTKSAWVFHDPKYQKLFEGADNWNVKFSIITLDENDAKRIEVGVPSPQERLEAMREYKEYIKNMQKLCGELGMRFYVSDAHFKETCDNCCCCALDKNWNYSRGHFGAALQIAKRTGKVQWKDIEKDMYFLDFPMVRAEGFNTNTAENRAHYAGMSMKDYLRYLWNAPKRGQSPYKLFERVLKPNGYDEDGNIIYVYNTGVTFQPHGAETNIDSTKV